MTCFRRRRGEEGAALILALVFVTVISFGLLALLSLTETGIRSDRAISEEESNRYALDAAVEGSIQAIRNDASSGRAITYTGGVNTCPTFSTTLEGVTATASCTGQQGVAGQPDSGGAGVTNNANNKPSLGIITTGTSALEPGIMQMGNDTLNIHGGVFSSSPGSATQDSIAVSGANSKLVVEGDVFAKGNCDNTKIFSKLPPYTVANGGGTNQALKCNTSTSQPSVTTAMYDPSITSVPSSYGSDAVPTSCPATPTVIKFSPGYYDDASSLSALAQTGGCTGNVLWFQPGNYYFDFRNTGSHLWTINDPLTDVVGGTPTGWTASSRPVIPVPSSLTPNTRGCAEDTDPLPADADPTTAGVQAPDPSNSGVQFVFGGDSRLADLAGTLQLCAQPSTTKQQIAVYGLRPGQGSTASDNQKLGQVLNPSGSTAATGFTANDSKGYTIGDGQSISATVAKNSAASITFTGYNQLADLNPAGILKATLFVGATVTSPLDQPAVDIIQAGGAASVATTTASTAGVDITGVLRSGAELRNGAGAGPQIKISVNNPSKTASGTATIDGSKIVIDYVSPALQPTSAAATGFSNAGSTPLVVDRNSATVTLAKNTSAAESLTGFDQLSSASMPAGSQISRVLLRTSYGASSNKISSSVGLKDAQGVAVATVNLASCTSTTPLCTEDDDLTASLTRARQLNSAAGAHLSVVFNVANTGNTANDAAFDGLQLIVVYTPPVLHEESGCIAKVPYSSGDATTCALLRTLGAKSNVYIYGTAYAPLAALDLQIPNDATQTVGRGVVARALLITLPASYTYNNIPVIQVPDDSNGVSDRYVDIYACLGSPVTCDNSNAKAHAVVHIVDTDASGNLSVGYRVLTTTWAVRR